MRPPRVSRYPLARRHINMSTRLAIGLALIVMAVSCGSRPRVFAVHLADYGESARSGRVRIDMPHGEAPLYAETIPVLDEHDFASVSFGEDEAGGPALVLCFTPEGRAKFAQVVKENVGRRLVFLIRARLLFAPVIDSSEVPACAKIHGYVSAQDAEALKRAIR